MNVQNEHDPLHGVTLKMMLEALVSFYGWGELGIYVKIRCFNYNPSVKSSLAFLRKTPWARSKIERLYCDMLDEKKAQQTQEKIKNAWSAAPSKS